MVLDGVSLEGTLLHHMTTAEGMVAVLESGITPEVFTEGEGVNEHSFKRAIEYWKKAGVPITAEILAKEFPNFRVGPSDGRSVEMVIQQMRERYAAKVLKDLALYAAEHPRETPLEAMGTLSYLVELWRKAAGNADTTVHPDLFDVLNEKKKLLARIQARREVEEEQAAQAGPTSWEPHDLAPYLRGEIEMARPTLGVVRSDGQRFIYPGCDHTIISKTGAGKTWIADACVAAEIAAGNHVVYVHYEEADPASTIERLLLLGVDPDDTEKLLTFVGPSSPVRDGYLAALLDPAPVLVIHDGMNEAMALHAAGTKEIEGAALFRQRLSVPFLLAGAATLSCDHFPMGHDPNRLDAYGTVHKGTGLSGARFALENVETFGRGMRGRSNFFVTKDRPGFVNRLGNPTKVNGKRFLGTLVIDATEIMGRPHFEFELVAPTGREKVDQESRHGGVSTGVLADAIHRLIDAQPNHEVESQRQVYALLRKEGVEFTDDDAKDVLDDFLVSDPPRLVAFDGPRGAKGYRAVGSAS